MVNPEDLELLDYYKNVCNSVINIRHIFENNSINYYISDIDFQLNSGVIQLLRTNKLP